MRIMAILQLCLAFTALLCGMSRPFLGDLYEYRSQALLYRNVMGDSSLATSEQDQTHLRRNRERFFSLPKDQQETVTTQYEKLKEHIQAPFFSKLKRSFHIAFFELSLWERAWIFFSIVISILILLQIEGTLSAAWILPIIALFYGISSFHANPTEDKESALFPSESLIIKQYLQEPLGTTIAEQHRQLLYGWKLYLIREWAKETPLLDHPLIFDEQVGKGEFAFNLKRLEIKATGSNLKSEPESALMCFLYAIWNLGFACAGIAQQSSTKQLYKKSLSDIIFNTRI